jgi:hypothetical protein
MENSLSNRESSLTTAAVANAKVSCGNGCGTRVARSGRGLAASDARHS